MSTTLEGSAAVKGETAPEPDDPRKPESPPDLHKRSWWYTTKMASQVGSTQGIIDE